MSVAGPILADVVLAAMAVEFVVLVAAGRSPRAALLALLPGALLVVALRTALAGAGPAWIAVPLALSLPAHLADLRARGRPARRGTGPRREPHAAIWRGI